MPSTIILHNAADLTLVLGKEKQEVEVAKSALRMVSSVWCAMFGSDWAEHKATSIDLPEDDPHAMLIVLRIAHYQHKELPKKLTMEELVNLAVVCDKYDTVHLVRHFLDQYNWTAPNKNCTLYSSYGESLFVSWTFGNLEDFQRVARDVLMNIEVDRNGAVGKGWALSHLTPSGFIENILQVRANVIARIRLLCAELYISGSKASCGVVAPYNKPECRAMILGSVMNILKTVGYVVVPDTEPTLALQSLKNIRLKLQVFKIYTFEELNWTLMLELYKREMAARNTGFGQFSYKKETPDEQESRIKSQCRTSHEACGKQVDIAEKLANIIRSIPSPVLDSHKRHIEIQAAKGV
ncbi:hypothetical protein BCR34DRAFT_561762 [Clohesyomyces aquaticus]|uniref:BTB domain-containing protein n=1 Tax=Clohesyomyces aquaticus TaxID=1231657 RepID=A0A1Y1ZU49_9PLEO|nr:hypothetical protein BCR34DRAFT_561762 [Clohesyomyces aquaticus]